MRSDPVTLRTSWWFKCKEIVLDIKRDWQPLSAIKLVEAQYALGCLYETGDSVLLRNLSLACYWFHEAAQNGQLDAQSKLDLYRCWTL